MYERFSDLARKTMQLANQAAISLNHEYIGTEHVLLGLLKEGSGIASNVLHNLNVDKTAIAKRVNQLVTPGPEMVSQGKMPQTPRAKKVIEHAIQAAKSLGHNYVGTEHILLGLMMEKEGVASQVLKEHGLSEESIRAEIANVLGIKAADEEVRIHIERIKFVVLSAVDISTKYACWQMESYSP